MNNLDTTQPHNYSYLTEHLEVHILGGIKVTKLETLRITLSVQKPGGVIGEVENRLSIQVDHRKELSLTRKYGYTGLS